MIRRFFISFILLAFSLSALADAVLNPNHPQKHVVVKGDTLWDISGLFLKYPWHWPDIWQVNPQIKNPHLIYPGDILTLVYRDGKPVLELTRGPTAYKMSPEIRELALERAIPTIPLDALRPFLSRPSVVAADVLDNAPYIVSGSDERLISAEGDRVYVRHANAEDGNEYSVFRGGEVYHDPETKELLGYEAIFAGDAWLSNVADISTALLRETNREVLIGDRLLPVVDEEEFAATFYPRTPETEVDGSIISVYDGVSQIGQYQIVVLNRGAREQLEVGHVVSIYKAGELVRDIVSEEPNDMVKLPDEYAGVAMVFKTFEKVSYAIVMKATRAIHVGDSLRAAE